MSKHNDLFSIIESILFVAGEAVSLKDISDILEVKESEIKDVLDSMEKYYKESNRGIMLLNLDNSFSLGTKPENSKFVQKLLKIDGRKSLSQAALETLAIIAYRQPITRIEIDEIRGVRSDRAIVTLLEKNIIKESGRKDSPGRPILFSTTHEFLKAFDLRSIENLQNLFKETK